MTALLFVCSPLPGPRRPAGKGSLVAKAKMGLSVKDRCHMFR